MTADRIAEIGIGINTTTYFKLMYIIYTGVREYGIVHTAVFGVN